MATERSTSSRRRRERGEPRHAGHRPHPLLALTAPPSISSLGTARAGDVSIASAAAVKTPLEAAAALSGASLGERLVIRFGAANAVKDGVAVDLVVLPPARLEELVRSSIVATEGRVPLGTVSLGAAVRAGAPQPAIATESDVRAAFLAAPSIGLADPASGATTGIYFAKLLGDLGLVEALKPRVRLFADGTAAMEALARGEVALAAGQISETRPVVGVDLVGPLPDSMQLRTVYAAGIATHAARPEAARAVVALLRSARMAPAFSAAGFDPPPDATPRP